MSGRCAEAIAAVLAEAVAPAEQAIDEGEEREQVLRRILHAQRMTLDLVAAIHATHGGSDG